MGLKEPSSLEEAKQYIGETILKFFPETKQEYKGKVQDVDTELETSSGDVETGFFFRIMYEDDDEEHLVWKEFAKCLTKARKQSKGAGAPEQQTPASGGATADVTAVNDRSSNKRQRRAGAGPTTANGSTAAAAAAAAGTPLQHADAADSDYEQPARGSAGNKRRRAGNQQQQQQQEQHEVEAASPPGVASPSLRKHPRKSARPRMAVLPTQQQQQDQGQRRQQQRHRSTQHAAAAAGDEVDDDEEEEQEDAADGDDSQAGSDEETPQQRRRQQQQQRGSKRARSKQQQQRHVEPDEDEEMEDAAAEDENDDDADEQDLQDNQQQQQEEDFADADGMGRRPLVVRQKGLAGHIKHVQVQNFMCHHNFLMEFGTHVNVISGRNGSGKSAVLQAMQAALGAKAKDTGRGDNFRELVRTGCNEACVKVTLWNTGEDAYLHEQYGDWVTIERVIKANSGGTQYKLINAAGKKIAEGHKKVLALLDHLNVDASNPLAVLTQDTARNFLCGSVADKKKYEIFMKATCLQTMHDHLLKASQYVAEMKCAFSSIKEEHDERKQKLVDVKKKLEKLQQSATLVQQRTQYERATVWAAVKCQQNQLTIFNQQLEVTAPQKKAKLEACLAQGTAKLEEVQARIDELLSAQQAEEEHNRSFTDAMADLARELKAAKAVCRGRQQAAKKLEAQLQRLQAEIKQCMEAKRETNDDRQREYEEKLQQHQAAMDQARAALQQAETNLAAVQQQRDALRETLQGKEAELQRLHMRMQGEQQTHANLLGHLQQLQAAKGQKLAMFGPHATLRQLVDSNRRSFKHAPIGPIGAHLTLTDVKWAVAGEVALGGALESWIVDNPADNKTLRELAKRVPGIRAFNVLVINFGRQPYNIPDNKRLRPGWQNLRDFIKIDHPDTQARVLIDNKLMDETHYEVVVINEAQERCRDAIYSDVAGPRVPKAIHLSGSSWTNGRNGTRIASHYTNRRAPRIGASFEDDMAQTQQALEQSKARLAEGQHLLTVANGELQVLRQQMNALSHQEKVNVGNKARAAHRVQQLQMQTPVLEVDQADGEDLVAEQLRTLQEMLQGVQLQYDKAAMELQEARIREEQAQKLHADRKAEMDQAMTQMDDRQEQLHQLADEKETASKYKAAAEAKLAELDRQVTALQQRRSEQAKIVVEVKQAAQQHCTEEEGWAALTEATELLRAEVESKLRSKMQQQWNKGQQHFESDEAFNKALEAAVKGNMDKLLSQDEGGGSLWFKKKTDMLDRTISAAEAEAGGNKDVLEESLRRAQAVYKKNDKAVQNMQALVNMSTRAVAHRWSKYDELFESVRCTVSEKFHGYMWKRGHQGRVDVNTETGELKLLVKMNTQGQGADGRKSKAVKDLKQLSGGERSYTTVAFILALGKFTESPFRAMDEYDVFMDAVNRRIATQTLLAFALEEVELQFVLLTPQDLQAVEDAKQHLAAGRNGQPLPDGFVKVVQMRPAREGGQQHH